MRSFDHDGPWDYPSLIASVDAAEDAITLCDAMGNLVHGNSAAVELLGLSVPELTRKTVTDFGRPFMHGFQAEAVKAVSSGSVEVTVRAAQLRHTSGTPAVVDLTIFPVVTEGGPMVAIVLSHALGKIDGGRMWKGLLEAAPDAMVIVNRSGGIVLVNAQVEALFGYERSELIGQTIEVLVPGRFAGMHKAFRDGYLREPEARPMGLEGHLFAQRKDGSEFPVEISLAPLETEDGLLVSAAVRDVSERQRLQLETDRIKDEFFATVSHELRTPLTSMIGYGELMSDLEDLSPQGQRFLSVITRSAERELRLVDDLLTLVAIEESGLSMRPESIDLEAVVLNAVEAARPPAEEAGLGLSVEVGGQPVMVSGDPDRLGQALDNLLSNAVKFTPKQGSVKVTLRVHGGFAHVDVADTGVGIGDVEPDQLFERLVRGGSAVAQQIPGAGLGLTIALAVAEAHAGTIAVLHSDESGSTFRLSLPLLS